jgi:aldehyde:ferredoxin oxidoreductase
MTAPCLAEGLYNQRIGVSAAADTLPTRFTAEPVPSGKHRGRICDLQGLLDAYYPQRGWPRGEAVLPTTHHHPTPPAAA